MKKDFKVLLINCNTMFDTLVTAGIGTLYVRFPKGEWPLIKICEGNGPQAESLYQELSNIYTEKFMR